MELVPNIQQEIPEEAKPFEPKPQKIPTEAIPFKLEPQKTPENRSPKVSSLRISTFGSNSSQENLKERLQSRYGFASGN